MSGPFQPLPRFRLYLENIQTGERQVAMVKGAALLSKHEAKNAAIIFNSRAIKENSPWRYKIEKM